MKKYLTLLTLLSIPCFAEDLGTYGRTYSVSEPDMVEFIKSRAQTMMNDGSWDKIKQDSIVRAKDSIYHPSPVQGITHTRENKSYYYNPMFELKQDLTDGKGKIIAKAGQYNPLTYKPFPEELIFIDGGDAVQVKWAVERFKTNNKKTKIILTSGSYMDLDKEYKIWFYYDQHGSYSTRLGIKHVPATVNQDGKQIRIDEIALEGDS